MALLSANMKVASSMRPAMRQAMALPLRRSVRPVSVRASAQKPEVEAGFEAGKVLALTSVASTWMMSGNANAATELMQMAANDNRAGILLTLFVPVLGWVAFNILQPAKNQLDRMDELRSVAGAVGLAGALSLLLADKASAATELAQLAESDNRAGILLTLFVPVIGWVGFNILQPAKNQLDRMDELRSVAGAVGIAGALSLLLADKASAATELAQLAESDNRVGILLTLFVPVIGWVGFNILQPAKNQLDRMDELRSVAGAVGIGGALSLLLADKASAVAEIAQLAESDNRVGIIATLFAPVLGWVAFNILQPALNQLDRMDQLKDD